MYSKKKLNLEMLCKYAYIIHVYMCMSVKCLVMLEISIFEAAYSVAHYFNELM